LITPEIICCLIEFKKFILMKINFKHKYYDQTFIINFLSIYKINRNKTSLSDKELQNIININVIININNKTKN